jgi:3-isopropylmalate dehydrogenase
VQRAVESVLEAGYRTGDLVRGDRSGLKLVGTMAMGDAVIAALG